MAGPSASVLASFEAQRPEYSELLGPFVTEWHDATSFGICDTQKFGGCYKGEQRPFVGGFEPFAFDEQEWPDDAATSKAIRDATGRDFTHYIVVAAMCNQPVDHLILCELVAALATAVDGIVDFDGIDAPSDAKLTRVDWSFEGQDWHTYLGSGDDAKRWIAHPQFRMCK
ncbi:MAG: hypothetical protein GY880_25790 [Planctomycetaceae bacterium]|nr:hypothetical protein [Planctomycetaceae bacterium]MCP4891726.1 hypothetical protein [Planctomycetaceae bacterium]